MKTLRLTTDAEQAIRSASTSGVFAQDGVRQPDGTWLVPVEDDTFERLQETRGDPFEFTVEGSGTFPFDMLRYDACYPADEALDSPAVGMTRDDPDFFGFRRVVLVSRREQAPTDARWLSHTWRVVGLGAKRDPKEWPTPPYRRGA